MTDIPRRMFLSFAGLALLPAKLIGGLVTRKPEPCGCGTLPDSFTVTITEGSQGCCEPLLMPPTIQMSIGDDHDVLVWNPLSKCFEGELYVLPEADYLRIWGFSPLNLRSHRTPHSCQSPQIHAAARTCEP